MGAGLSAHRESQHDSQCLAFSSSSEITDVLLATEGIIDTPDDYQSLAFCDGEDTNTVAVTLKPSRRKQISQILDRRGFISQTSCGLCGKEIVKDLDCDRKDLFKWLRRLDELNLIELHSKEKIKLLVSRTPRWTRNGPLSKRYGAALIQHFYADDFNQPHFLHEFHTGTLSEESEHIMARRVQNLVEEFFSLSELDRNLDSSKTRGYWFVTAMRPWDPLGVIQKLKESRN